MQLHQLSERFLLSFGLLLVLTAVLIAPASAYQPPSFSDDIGNDTDISISSAEADLIISKSGILLPGANDTLGEKIEWLITIENPGEIAAENVIAVDALRPELQLDSVATPRGTASVEEQTVIIEFGTLDPNEHVTYSIVVAVLENTAMVDNTVLVTADNMEGVRQETISLRPAILQLPRTGEAPWWRTPLLAFLLIGSWFVLMSLYAQRNRALHADVFGSG